MGDGEHTLALRPQKSRRALQRRDTFKLGLELNGVEAGERQAEEGSTACLDGFHDGIEGSIRH